MKRWHIYVVIAVVIVLTFLIFGHRIGLAISALFGAGGIKQKISKQKKTIDEKEKDYSEAGDDVEAKKYEDHESAANAIDDIFDDSDSSK